MARTDEERQASNVDAGAAMVRRPLLDSGATIHVFSDGWVLRNPRFLPFPKRIGLADGRLVYADVVGDIDMEDMKLKNVYVVTDLKMDLVSVGELAKIGIITTFYKNHAELRKGTEMVGGAMKGTSSLYELQYLWAAGEDASDTTPEVPSGSEPWMVAAVNLPHLEPLKHYQTVDDLAVGYGFWERDDTLPLSELRQSFDDADVCSAWLKQAYSQYSSLVSKFYQSDKTGGGEAYIQYSSLVSKFYQSDKTGGGLRCNNEVRDGSVYVKAHMGPDPDGMHEADFMKSLKDYEVRNGSVYVKAHMGPDPDGMHEADFMKSLKDNEVRDGSVYVKAHMGRDPDGVHEADFMKSLKDYGRVWRSSPAQLRRAPRTEPRTTPNRL